nr:low calcium response locus protein S [Bradyrhizobium sp. DOA9]
MEDDEGPTFSDARKTFYPEAGQRRSPGYDICRKAGISQATCFTWKTKYDGLLPTETRRLKKLEDENAKLKKLVADLSLDKEMLHDVIRRKLLSLVGSASSPTRFVVSGRCRSARAVRLSTLTGRPIITSLVARAGRPRSSDQGDLPC